MLIGELSRRSNVNIETIRYYERDGVIPIPSRTAGGQRVYDNAYVMRLSFVRRCRALGFGLNQIKNMLHMVDDNAVSCDHVKHMAQNHLTDVRSKISDLKKMEDVLAQTISLCRGGKDPDCPIIEALFSKNSETDPV